MEDCVGNCILKDGAKTEYLENDADACPFNQGGFMHQNNPLMQRKTAKLCKIVLRQSKNTLFLADNSKKMCIFALIEREQQYQ